MPDRRLDEIVQRQTEINEELSAIEDLPEPEGDDEVARAQTLAERGSMTDELIAEYNRLETEREPLAKRAEERARVQRQITERVQRSRQFLEHGDAGGRNDGSVFVRAGGRRQDPYRDLDLRIVRSMSLDERTVSNGHRQDLVARATSLVEQVSPDLAPAFDHDEKEETTRKIERASRRQGPLIAAHCLLTGQPEYTEVFLDYMHAPLETVQRAALSLTNANGGYLIPFTLDPSIILTNAGSINPYRQTCAVKTIATNNWNGVASTGMNAAWLAEAGVVTDNSPTFTNVVITPAKASAWVFGSYEVLEDTDFETELPGLLADARDRLEENAFAVGDGSGKPKGITVAATTVYTTADTTGHTIAVGDLFGVQAALPARFRGRASWLAGISAINRARQLDTAGGSSYWTNLGDGSPEKLLGGAIRESSSIPAYSAAAGQLAMVYGDFSQYAIVDRVGMSVMYEPMIKDVTTGRPVGQGGWFAFWRVGGDALVPGAFRVLKTG